MTSSDKFWCLTFVGVDSPREGLFEIQWQYPMPTITCIAHDLRFARAILTFVAETRGNPAYRDTPLGGGVYRHMPQKSIDLSPSFESSLRFMLQKLGESDDSYQLVYEAPGALRCQFELHAEELDAFLDGIREIVEENVPDEG